MIGKTISHYKILEKIGEGGMGIVYKAQDQKLDRFVALKFLSKTHTSDKESIERFQIEAKSAAALNHPNIITIYEIGEHEEQLFIAMEYLEGETLRKEIEENRLSRLRPNGATSSQAIRDIRSIVEQICEGLDKAHEKGIVHRDIKPENILIDSKGRVKILDFGLAKLKGAGNLTKDNSTLGTAKYLSPEQAGGEKVDNRSDIWSVGVVLYEMLTGQLPFKGEYEAAIIHSIMNVTHEPVSTLISSVPVDLDIMINKCLAKDPAKRYQHVDDLLVDLRRAADSLTSSVKSGKENGTTGSGKHSVFARMVGMAAVTLVAAILLVVVYPHFFGFLQRDADSDVKKLAVLFFKNLGPPDDEFFADGITDAITARLAVIHGLGVISRQSTIQYKDSDKSIQDIGDELGVDYILEGTIQRERPGDPTSRVRIIPQLISVSDDIHLWANTYDEDMTEVFRVQSSIAERVARALNVTLLEPEREALETTPTQNLEAYEYYLRGNEYFNKRLNLENSTLASKMYEKAIELDPEFAAAWAGLSEAYIWGYYTGYDLTPDPKTEAKAAVDKAGELNPGSPDVQIALGYYYYYGDRDFDRALDFFESVLTDRPNNVEILNPIAFIKRRQNKWDECVVLLEKAIELNPRFHNSVLELGSTYVFMRQYDKAERLLNRAIFFAPEDLIGHSYKIWLFLLRDGDTEKAKEALMEALEVLDLAVLSLQMSSFVHIRTMPETYAELLGQVPPEELFAEDTTWAYLVLAEMNLLLGQKERAYEYWNNVLDLLEPNYDEEWSYHVKTHLGLAYAGLGRKEEAIRMTRDVLTDFPLSWDALDGTLVLEMAALTFVRAGEYEAAIDQLELLLSVPSLTSRSLFRLDPAWDPLRDNPRFRKLLENQ